MTNLILCGGSGTRLWPLSRTSMPKQFAPLFDGVTLFEETIRRNRALVDRFWVASNAAQMVLAQEQMRRNGIMDFGELIEPVGRNTAPAIALVCQNLPEDELVLVTPSDHRISRPHDYAGAVHRARELAADGFLVAFGIRPAYPETGFGYIEAEGEVIRSFREKPNLEIAQEYVNSGHHFWNSGMFVFQAGVFLQELARHSPEVAGAVASIGTRPTLDQMMSIPSESIDYAVMERTDRGRVVVCDPGWSDLGSFDAIYDLTEHDPAGNGRLHADSALLIRSKRNLVVGASRRVVLVDVDDLIVVDTPDALLVTRRGQSQHVKDVVNLLKEEQSRLLD